MENSFYSCALLCIGFTTLGALQQLPAPLDFQHTRKKSKSRLRVTQETLPNTPPPRLSPLGRENRQKWLAYGSSGKNIYIFLNPPKKFSNKYFFIFSIFIEILVKNWSSGNMEKIENQLFWSFSRFKLFTCT